MSEPSSGTPLNTVMALGLWATASLPTAQSWHSAAEQFERELLERLYPAFPSSRKLAERLGLSRNAIATKLRRYGIGSPTAS